jgi:glycosyltransferase involved in cell wall biosynthesis
MKNRSAHLAIVGPDDGLLAEIQASVDHLKLNQRVHFVGQVPDDDVLSAYQDADLYVLPSRKDCFPVSVMECCLVGTPMIVSDRCEIAAVVKDKNATVVSLDTGEIAAAMDRLLENQILRESYRNNSERVLKNHFSITSCVDRLESVYKRCIEQG